MLPLSSLGERIATKRKTLGLTQPTLAKKASVGLSTLDALENGRLGELGYSKITNIPVSYTHLLIRGVFYPPISPTVKVCLECCNGMDFGPAAGRTLQR